MKSDFLLPRGFRTAGIALLIISIIPGYMLALFMKHPHLSSNIALVLAPTQGTYLDEISSTLITLSLFLIAFSRLKEETERTDIMRQSALYRSVIIYCFVFIFITASNSFSAPWSRYLTGYSCYYQLYIPLAIFNCWFYYAVFFKKDIKAVYLIPNRPYKFIGEALLIIFTFIIAASFSEMYANSLKKIPTELVVLLPIALLLCVWAKAKTENAVISTVRFKAMQMTLYIYYALHIVLNWVVYGYSYMEVIALELVGIPLLFVVLFALLMWLDKQKEEKASSVLT